MKTQIQSVTIAIGLLSGALVYANNQDSQTSKDSSQSNQSSAQQQEQNPVKNESAGTEQSGQKVTFDQLPQPVQKTIRAHAGDLNVENIRKQTINGQSCYQASFDKDNMKGRLTVAEDGSLLRFQQAQDLALVAAVPQISEAGTQLSDLPEAVQKTIKEQAGSDQVGNISKTQQNGRTVYHAGFNEGGAHTDLFVNQNGELIAKTEQTALFVAPIQGTQKVSLDSAPAAVQQTVRREAGSAQIADLDKGTWNGQQVYKVMLDKNGTPVPLVVSESGKVLGQDISEAAGAEKKNQNENQQNQQNQEQQNSQNDQQLKDQK